MRVLFIDQFNDQRVVKEHVPEEEVIGVISAFVKELNPNYKIPYVRWWCEEDGKVKCYDVGSHSEFFKAEED